MRKCLCLVWMCFLLLAAVSRRFLCCFVRVLVLVGSCLYLLFESWRKGNDSLSLLYACCCFKKILVLVCVCAWAGLFLFVLATSILVKKDLYSGSCDHMLSHDKKVILNDKSNPKTQTVTLKTTKIILKVNLKAILKTSKVILKQQKIPKTHWKKVILQVTKKS